MSEPSKSYWYHNGWLVLGMVITIILVTGWLYRSWQQAEKPIAFAEVYGQLQQPNAEQPILHMTLVNRFPGILRNGRISVTTPNRLLVAASDRSQVYAFDEWQPNDDHAVNFDLRLNNFHPQNRIPLTIRVEAQNARVYQIQDEWRGEGWVSNQD